MKKIKSRDSSETIFKLLIPAFLLTLIIFSHRFSFKMVLDIALLCTKSQNLLKEITF